MERIEIKNLFDLEKTMAKPLFDGCKYPFEVLPKISEYIVSVGKTLSMEEYIQPSENVWIHKTATVAPTASISGPCIIEKNAEIRQCAYIRGSAIVGEGATVGNSCEVKNSILFNNSQIPHYNYCGDSIIGYKSHMGAGAITSNLKSDKTLITIKSNDFELETGIKKIGAILGDNVEVGCNSVLNPGTIIGANSTVYPLSMVRGFIPANSIFKDKNNIVLKK